MDKSRRNFIRRSSLFGAAGLLAGSKVANAQHEGHVMPKPEASARLIESLTTDRQPQAAKFSCTRPDVPKLPWTMDNGVKVFRLIQRWSRSSYFREKRCIGWGYNGSMPGPTVEVNEGDRVRFIVTNKLPEATTMHWHGLEVPLNMDGAPFISQPLIEPGQTFVYEFTVHQNGTFFYHSHMAMQEMMGMIGLFIIHPKQPHSPHVDKDFGLILQEWALLPNNPIPNSLAMEFNWLTINGKAGPATTPMIVKQGERVRLTGRQSRAWTITRCTSMAISSYVTGTEGGRAPESTWFPHNTVL